MYQYTDVVAAFTGWHLLSGDGLNQLLSRPHGITRRYDDNFNGTDPFGGFFQCRNGFWFIVFNRNHGAVGFNDMADQLGAFNDLFSAFAHQAIIGGEIRLALAAVNDQGFDFKPTPLTQLNGGGKNRPTHANDTGFFHQTGQLFLRNAVRVFVRVQLDPFLQAVGFQQYSSRR